MCSIKYLLKSFQVYKIWEIVAHKFLATLFLFCTTANANDSTVCTIKWILYCSGRWWWVELKDQCEHKTILCDLSALLCVCGKRELLLQVKCIRASGAWASELCVLMPLIWSIRSIYMQSTLRRTHWETSTIYVVGMFISNLAWWMRIEWNGMAWDGLGFSDRCKHWQRQPNGKLFGSIYHIHLGYMKQLNWNYDF